MVYVMDLSGHILNGMDAWALDAIERMEEWAIKEGYKIVDERITDLGNFKITVEARG